MSHPKGNAPRTLGFQSGRHCRHFEQGRCLYQEFLNQGLDRDLECRVLRGWEQAFDDFIHRAENFNLDEVTAGHLWRRTLRRLHEGEWPCPDHAPAQGEETLDCCHARDHLCLLAFPPCTGRCRWFVLKEGVGPEGPAG